MNDSTLDAGAGGPEGYRLLDLLGRGAFGEVWRAEAPGGVKVAVKILSLALKPAEAKRELAALNSMLELRHPYLLSLQAIFYHGDRIFVVMELADGSLGSRLAEFEERGQAGIPVRELLGYLREAAEAIDFLHAHDRLHRDIKPDNILLVAGHAKVADYGLARVLEKQQTARTNSVVGTPSFMAPETWKGTVGPRSDQYSLAATYVQLRRGYPPFTGQNLPHLAYLHMNQPPNLDGIDGAERRVIEKALAKKSAERFPTCMAFVAALARAVQSAAVLAAPTKAIPDVRPAKKVPVSKPATAKGGRREIVPTLIEPPAKPTRPAGRDWRLAWVGCLALLFVATAAGIGGWLYNAGRDDRNDSGRTIAFTTKPIGSTSPGGGSQVTYPGSGKGSPIIRPAETRRAAPNTGRGGDLGGKATSKGGDLGGNRVGGDVIEVEIADTVKMTFCWIPPGKATLGSPATETNHSDDEVEHEYPSRGFWLAKFPATQEQWRALMKDNPTPGYFKPGQDDIKKAGVTDTSLFPVENVSWNDCQDFLGKMNAAARAPAAMGKGKFVLPHEDEWEYACRGSKGNRQPFYFGDRLNGDKANCDGNYPYGTEVKGEYKERTTKVGEYEGKAPHPWGLCDMHGNVYQWCDNLYKGDKDSRVLRGGSWGSVASSCRAALRGSFAPGDRDINVGFRPCFRLD